MRKPTTEAQLTRLVKSSRQNLGCVAEVTDNSVQGIDSPSSALLMVQNEGSRTLSLKP